MTQHERIYLSSPHLGELEQKYVQEAFDTNWIAPLGPNVDAFEAEFCEVTGAPHAAALSSGTAAIHLALRLLGVERGDEVLVSDLTFVASANPVLYEGARPTFIDCERTSWNMDPDLLEEVLDERGRRGDLPAAVMLVHLYGQTADVDRIKAACAKWEVPLIEDAAEALGSSYKGRHPGNDGVFGIFSFNGNKIITTSGGGMLVSHDEDLIRRSRKLATQARDDAPHYQHSEVGFNYRLSNICAGIGRGQLAVLGDRVAQRRAVFDRYVEALGDVPGFEFQPEAPWGVHTRWLTCLTVDPEAAGVSNDDIRDHLGTLNIESRPVWKPMHLQPLFEGCEFVGSGVSAELFEYGLCLPSGSNMSRFDQDRVIDGIRDVLA
jgi:pyridoxal phosphate-dependent aminotransferase EpsN